ncbi:MAG: hypothetical protein ACOY4U_11315 [Pseudomonadota bacterium]
MDENSRLILGAILIALGALCALFGDRKVPAKEGAILRLFSHPKGQMHWLKWPIGAALVWAGLAAIFHW